jgi:hypothetical protein
MMPTSDLLRRSLSGTGGIHFLSIMVIMGDVIDCLYHGGHEGIGRDKGFVVPTSSLTHCDVVL